MKKSLSVLLAILLLSQMGFAQNANTVKDALQEANVVPEKINLVLAKLKIAEFELALVQARHDKSSALKIGIPLAVVAGAASVVRFLKGFSLDGLSQSASRDIKLLLAGGTLLTVGTVTYVHFKNSEIDRLLVQIKQAKHALAQIEQTNKAILD